MRKNKGDYNRRRERECEKEDAHVNCPFSCGLCYEDDTSFAFKADNRKRYYCAWIAKRPHTRADKYCVTVQKG